MLIVIDNINDKYRCNETRINIVADDKTSLQTEYKESLILDFLSLRKINIKSMYI